MSIYINRNYWRQGYAYEACKAVIDYLWSFERGMGEKIMSEMIGKCGFYCGACPTYLAGNCLGCVEEHKEGDCFTRDCVIKSGIRFCGECKNFPCDTILTEPHTTVLDKDWLRWKKNSNTNR